MTTTFQRPSSVDRRKSSDRQMSNDLGRIRKEYVEMPGLTLTLPQAARLWNLSQSRCAQLLSMLVETRFLVCDNRTVYRRRLDCSETRNCDARPLPTKAKEIVSTQEIGKALEPWDIVDEASFESFPASDPPSWTFGVDSK